MTELPPQTPDHILRSRTLSDADLLDGGADFDNGVLKVTPTQLETIKNRHSVHLGETAVSAAGLTLHRPEYAQLEYLSSDTAMENESSLQSDLSDIMTIYEDTLRTEFPRKVKLFDVQATASHNTSRLIGNREVNYTVDFTGYKAEGRKVRPGKVEVKVDMYGKHWPGDARDFADFSYDTDGKIKHISVNTAPLPPYIYKSSDMRGLENVKKKTLGPFREGIAQEIIEEVDPKALPETQIYDDGSIDTSYNIAVTLEPGKYELKLSRNVGEYAKHARTVGEDRLKKQGTEVIHYRFDPGKNCFIKLETAKPWNAGPDELEVDQFLDIVKMACANIPTFGDAPATTDA